MAAEFVERTHADYAAICTFALLECIIPERHDLDNAVMEITQDTP